MIEKSFIRKMVTTVLCLCHIILSTAQVSNSKTILQTRPPSLKPMLSGRVSSFTFSCQQTSHPTTVRRYSDDQYLILVDQYQPGYSLTPQIFIGKWGTNSTVDSPAETYLRLHTKRYYEGENNKLKFNYGSRLAGNYRYGRQTVRNRIYHGTTNR